MPGIGKGIVVPGSVRQGGLLNVLQQPLSRFVSKMLTGNNVLVSFLGDSILEGNSATAGNDVATLVCSQLSTDYGVTVTKNNLANSGDRVYNTFIGTARIEKAITDNSDLVVIGFGRNDLKSDMVEPGIGYPIDCFIGTFEHALRRLRKELPAADIIIMLENPMSVGASANPYHETQNILLNALATAYNCAVVDGYAAFTLLGNWNAYLADGSHPNDDGYLVLKNAFMAKLQADDYVRHNFPNWPVPAPINARAKTFINPSIVLRTGTASFTNIDTPRYRVQSNFVGNTTSTAGDYANFLFWGDEVVIRIVCGAGQGVIKIYADQNVIYAALDLSTYSAGSRYIPIKLTNAGVHSVTVELVSGSMTIEGFVYKKTNASRISCNDTSLVYSNSNWNAFSTAANAFFFNVRNANAIGATIEFDFTGTGLGIEAIRYSVAGRGVNVEIDGVNLGDIDFMYGANGKGSIYSGVLLASGLANTQHHVKITAKYTISIAGFYILDGLEAY